MQRRPTLLVANEITRERESLARLLRARDYGVVTARNLQHALHFLGEPVDLVIAEPHLDRHDGLSLLKSWKRLRPGTPFIMVTDDSDVRCAVEAMKLGATDYLGKPVDPELLVTVIKRCLEPLANEATEYDAESGITSRIVGNSAPMQKVLHQIKQAAQAHCTVIITGESGTGKELVAQAIHRNSARREGPFLATNMAAVPDALIESELFGHVNGAFTGAEKTRIGRFEAANDGTLFVDEIGDLKLSCQAKLLRVLENHRVTPVGGNEDRTVDVRVLAATNHSLKKMVVDGTFREDLYYRLNVVTIALPPLRDRRDDIPLLVDHFLNRFCAQTGRPRLQPDAGLMEFFQKYSWPGNIRQLQNCLESMVVLSPADKLTVDQLPVTIRSRQQGSRNGRYRIPPGTNLRELERQAILQTLDRCGGNRVRTAKQLGIAVRTLQRKLQEWEAA